MWLWKILLTGLWMLSRIQEKAREEELEERVGRARVIDPPALPPPGVQGAEFYFALGPIVGPPPRVLVHIAPRTWVDARQMTPENWMGVCPGHVRWLLAHNLVRSGSYDSVRVHRTIGDPRELSAYLLGLGMVKYEEGGCQRS